MKPELIVVGNLLVDDIVLADGRTLEGEPGGAVLYSALAAALWGAPVAIVSVRGDDYPVGALDALAARGVDLAGVRALGAPGVSTRLTYSDGGRRVEHQSGSATHDDVSPGPGDLGGVHRVARIVHLTPTPIARQLELVRHVASWSGPSCTVDPHDPVREDSRAAWLEVLALVEGFFPGEDELLLDGAAEDPRTALRRLETPRLELIAFKRGARGGLVWDVETDKFIEWRAGTGRVVDPTGAGDAFVGGFLAGRLRKEEIAASLERGIVAASFAIQDWGARGLLKATPELFERRRAEWFGARTNA